MHDMVESPSPSPTVSATPLRSTRSTRSMLRMLRAALRMPWRCGKRCKASTAGGGANVFLWRKQCRECGAKQPLRNYCWMCLSQIWINLDYHNVRSVWINYDQLNKVWTSQKLSGFSMFYISRSVVVLQLWKTFGFQEKYDFIEKNYDMLQKKWC